MKITRIETIPVKIPLKPGLTTRTAHGVHAESRCVMIRVHTDAGLVGLGEATVAPRWSGETSRTCVAIIEELLAPELVGRDPREISRLRARMDRVVKLHPFTKAGIEMALWDIAGKAAGLPVYELLGGKVRDEVPIKLVVGAFDPPEARALARRFLDMGVRTLKVKVGLDEAGDLARVAAVREEAGPNVPIGVDANCGWDVSRAKIVLGKLAQFDLLFAEQPIPPGRPEQLAEVRRATKIPIMADESVFTLADAYEVCAAQAADILSVYPGKHGGMAATVEIANVAKAAGITCSIGSNLELGVGAAAMLHVAVAVGTIDSEAWPADLIGPLYHEADLLRTPLDLGPPAARGAHGPGLGVELDEAQLEKFRER